MVIPLWKLFLKAAGTCSSRERARSGAWLACASLLISCGVAVTAQTQYKARVTQTDTSSFPHIRVYLSLTDESGNPISTSDPVSLKIFEDDTLVREETLSEGGSSEGSSVLVLDLSDSMEGEKLSQARNAAIEYVNLAPPSFQVAVVKFGRTASVVCRFTSDRSVLRGCINSLQDTLGKTALQEGIGAGLDLLRGTTGRREVIALTDGYENSKTEGLYKGAPGLQYLLQRAAHEEATISVIGLGTQINEVDLRRYEQTGGTYLASPTTNQLAAVFRKAAQLLESERVVEYDTTASHPDGTRGRIRPELIIGKNNNRGTPVEFVRPGLLPHVRGEHFRFIIVIVTLFVLPIALSLFGSFYMVWRFRARHVRRLEAGSAYLNRRDPNYDPSYEPFQVGDLIVVCPASNTPYYVRSWRLYKCQCGREPLCAGHFCYHRVLPQWVRSTLNKMFKNSEGQAGRTWLCHCAGDKFGY